MIQNAFKKTKKFFLLYFLDYGIETKSGGELEALIPARLMIGLCPISISSRLNSMPCVI
jgi:hypothetical protein